MSSFKIFPLKSKYVRELEILWFNDSACAIWLTPFAVRPHWDNDSLHKPLEILAIGPAKCIAPRWNQITIRVYAIKNKKKNTLKKSNI